MGQYQSDVGRTFSKYLPVIQIALEELQADGLAKDGRITIKEDPIVTERGPEYEVEIRVLNFSCYDLLLLESRVKELTGDDRVTLFQARTLKDFRASLEGLCQLNGEED